MCEICAQFRPFDPECAYEILRETTDAPASRSTTYTIGVNDSFIGSIGAMLDRDWVRVELTAGQVYNISVAAAGAGVGTLSDAYLRIYDQNGNLLWENDDSGMNLDAFLQITATYTGAYYIEASGFNNSQGSYILTVSDLTYSGNVNFADLAIVEEMARFLTHGYWEHRGGNNHNYTTQTITVNLTGLSDEGRQLARWSMEAWSMVANITFVEVTGNAQVTFQHTDGGAWAFNEWIGTATQNSTVNVSLNWLQDFGTLVGSYGFQTYIHEIGHALGLGHQGPYNFNGGFAANARFPLDSWQMSIMSYFSQTENPNTSANLANIVTPMMVDIYAIQQLYGAAGAGSVTDGNTVYGLNSNLNNYLGRLSRILVGQEAAAGFATGGAVAFTIYDYGGIDTIDLSPLGTDNRIDLTPGAFSDVAGGIGNVGIYFDTILENLRSGSGNDDITGNVSNNRLEAGAGNDTVRGMDGNDTLLGQAGNDALYGGTGNDQIFGGDGSDLAYGGIGSDRLSGELGNDTLYGGDGHDTIQGGKGADLIYGDAGNDRLLGGSGNDTLYGGSGSDVLHGDTGNDVLHGDTGADQLFGGDGNDLLYGGAGNDTLYAGSGRDTLFGGTGADVFVWTDAGQSLGGINRDTVSDFEVGVDLIDISALHDDLVFVSRFSGVAGQVRYAPLTARLYVDVDGDGREDFSIQFAAGTVLTQNDLIL